MKGLLFTLLFSFLSSPNLVTANPVDLPFFNDSHLKSLIASQDRGLIYIVSPQMPLSDRGILILSQLSREMNFHFTVLSDPHLPVSETSNPRLSAKSLLDMGALNHFPSTFFYKNGKLLPIIVPGFKDEIESRHIVQEYLNQNETVRPNFWTQNLNLPNKKIIILPKLVSVPLEFLPSFFFRMSPDGKYVVGYNSSSGNYENFLVKVNAKPPMDYKAIPGGPDAIFLTSSKWVVTTGSGVTVYPLDKLLVDEVNTQPIFTDEELDGVYQSVGVLKDDKHERIMRIMLGSGYSYELRDYSYNKTNSTFSPHSKLTKFCAGHNFKLPMLSKDGHEVAGYDINSQTSIIYKINPDMTCTIVKDLKRTTGKISFSYDGQWIAYHVSSDSDNDTDFISVPDENFTADIYLYHRPSEKTFQITQHKQANALYPDFLTDGSLVFIEYPHLESHSVIYKVDAKEIENLIKP